MTRTGKLSGPLFFPGTEINERFKEVMRAHRPTLTQHLQEEKR